MLVYLVKIKNFYPSTNADRDLRLSSSKDNLTFAGEIWTGGTIDPTSVTQFRYELNGDKPHAAFRIYAKDDAILNRFRNYLGFLDVEIFEITQ